MCKVPTYMHKGIHAYIHTYIPTPRLPSYPPTVCMHACMHASIQYVSGSSRLPLQRHYGLKREAQGHRRTQTQAAKPAPNV